MRIPLVEEMLKAAKNSVDDMRAAISNVKWDVENYQMTGPEYIVFHLEGPTIKSELWGKYRGALRGRNRDLLVGMGDEQDKAIALRVLLDGDAEKIA